MTAIKANDNFNSTSDFAFSFARPHHTTSPIQVYVFSEFLFLKLVVQHTLIDEKSIGVGTTIRLVAILFQQHLIFPFCAPLSIRHIFAYPYCAFVVFICSWMPYFLLSLIQKHLILSLACFCLLSFPSLSPVGGWPRRRPKQTSHSQHLGHKNDKSRRRAMIGVLGIMAMIGFSGQRKERVFDLIARI